MGLGIPGRNGSARSTELGALNEIIRKLTEVRNSISSGGGGSATLAEQQSQTALLGTIDANIASQAPYFINWDLLLTSIEASVGGTFGSSQNIETILNSANSPTHIQLTNPAAVSYTGFKELSFVCTGAITVTLDGNDIIYPVSLGTNDILGSTIKADVSSTNAVQFNGTGTVLITIQQ